MPSESAVFRAILVMAASVGAQLSFPSSLAVQLRSSPTLSGSLWRKLPFEIQETIERADHDPAFHTTDPYRESYGPNCHWLALAWRDRSLQTHPEFVNYDRLSEKLQSTYQRIDRNEAEAGDLLVFWSIGKDRYKDDQGRFYTVDAPVEPYHSAILLQKSEIRADEDLLFQKVNAADRLYQWATFAESLRLQSSALESRSSVHYRFIKFDVRYYRLR